MPPELGNLTNLRELSLWGNQLTGQIPHSLVNLTRLETLWLLGNDFTGCIPEALHDVSDNDLQYLGLPDCDGPPPPVECLHDCQFLLGIKDVLIGDGDVQLNWDADLPLGDWTGVEVDSEQQVTHLRLPESGLSGSIPTLLGDLHGLRELDLQENSLTGEIPEELDNLTELEELYLQGNQLTGEVPAWMGDFTNMRRTVAWIQPTGGQHPASVGQPIQIGKPVSWRQHAR